MEHALKQILNVMEQLKLKQDLVSNAAHQVLHGADVMKDIDVENCPIQWISKPKKCLMLPENCAIRHSTVASKKLILYLHVTA